MTVEKFITYTPFDINGNQLEVNHQLTLNVLETSGNYLLHKDLLRHYSSQRDEHEQAQIVHLYGKVVVLFLAQNQKKIY